MIEVYRDTSERLTLTILIGNEPQDATGDVLVNISLADETPVYTGLAMKADDTIGKYFWDMPLSLTTEDNYYKVRWTFTVSGEEGQSIDNVFVVTPYVDYDTFVAMTGSEMTYEEFRRKEPLVRNIIEAYTGQKFGKYMRTLRVRGLGTDRLHINLPILRIDSIAPSLPPTPIMPGAVTIPSLADNYEIKFDTVCGRYGFRFVNNLEYTITGLFGYTHVPSAVVSAAAILIADKACSDDLYRQKGITRVRAADWALDFGNLAYRGTGNVDADRLLGQFRIMGMVIV